MFCQWQSENHVSCNHWKTFMMFQKCWFFNLYNTIINNKRDVRTVKFQNVFSLVVWQMMFLSLLHLHRLFVLKETRRRLLPGGATWGRHRTTRVSPPGCSASCMFLSVFTLCRRIICKSLDTKKLTENTKHSLTQVTNRKRSYSRRCERD